MQGARQVLALTAGGSQVERMLIYVEPSSCGREAALAAAASLARHLTIDVGMLVRDEDGVDGAACWKIQSTPRETKSSQYTKSLVWVRKDNYAFARFENYVKDQVARRLDYSRIENVQGIWTAKPREMTDVRRGSRTRLTLDKLEYNVALKDEDFTLQAIRRQ